MRFLLLMIFMLGSLNTFAFYDEHDAEFDDNMASAWIDIDEEEIEQDIQYDKSQIQKIVFGENKEFAEQTLQMVEKTQKVECPREATGVKFYVTPLLVTNRVIGIVSCKSEDKKVNVEFKMKCTASRKCKLRDVKIKLPR